MSVHKSSISVSGEAEEIERLIRKSQSQPGLADLMAAYGQYETHLRRVEAFFQSLRPKVRLSTTDNTV